jgi:hypothetical protein
LKYASISCILSSVNGYSDAQIIECFHLSFLGVLRLRLDPARYVLKGGANLRYFFDSQRYSEGIDLDAAGGDFWKLEEKVDSVLSSPALGAILRSAGLEVVVGGTSKPKQTDTTRRWKVPIRASGRDEPIRTKIEFSNRNGEERYALETVPSRVVQPYGVREPSVQHYTAEPAAEQKVRALAGRSETQARDVFDLDLLLRRAPRSPGAVDQKTRKDAADRGVDLPFKAFADQVLPFLDPEVAELYDEDAWNQMQLFVADRLLEDQ